MEKAEQERVDHLNRSGFGLVKDEPLVFEKVIRSCFANPNRKNLPNFKNNNWLPSIGLDEYVPDDYNLSEDYVTAEFLIDSVRNLIPKAEQDFNKKNIRLHDPAFIWNSKLCGALSDPSLGHKDLFEALSKSHWIGPYTYADLKSYCIFSVVSDLSDQDDPRPVFVVKFCIDLCAKKVTDHFLHLVIYKHRSHICPYLYFTNRN